MKIIKISSPQGSVWDHITMASIQCTPETNKGLICSWLLWLAWKLGLNFNNTLGDRLPEKNLYAYDLDTLPITLYSCKISSKPNPHHSLDSGPQLMQASLLWLGVYLPRYYFNSLCFKIKMEDTYILQLSHLYGFTLKSPEWLALIQEWPCPLFTTPEMQIS